jgi:putative membrane protein
MFAAEQASFLGSGLFLWLSVLGGDAARRTAQAGSAIVALALTFAHMTLLGALLSLSPRPLYGHDEWSAAIADQQLGGAIMLIVGGVVYIAAGVWLGKGLVRRPRMRTGGA